MNAPQVIQVNQPGKVVGNKIKVGHLVMVPVDRDVPEGPKRPEIKLVKPAQTIPLGNGVELASTVIPLKPANLVINVTAEAAARLGWPHPANKPKRTQADIERLMPAACNEEYGENERADARRTIREISAEIAADTKMPRITYSWKDDPDHG